MNITVTGNRDYISSSVNVSQVLDLYKHMFAFVHVGDARGVDRVTLQWCRDNGIAHQVHKADWDRHGKSAGHIRNREMLKVSRGCLAIWDGQSLGTENCIQNAIQMDNIIWVCVNKVLTTGHRYEGTKSIC